MGTESILITISPSSESKPINLINAEKLIIERIEANSENKVFDEYRHYIFFIYKDTSRPPKREPLKEIKYDEIYDYIQFIIKNINSRFSLKVTYSIKPINLNDYNNIFLKM
jgi:hypothetical protein